MTDTVLPSGSIQAGSPHHDGDARSTWSEVFPYWGNGGGLFPFTGLFIDAPSVPSLFPVSKAGPVVRGVFSFPPARP